MPSAIKVFARHLSKPRTFQSEPAFLHQFSVSIQSTEHLYHSSSPSTTLFRHSATFPITQSWKSHIASRYHSSSSIQRRVGSSTTRRVTTDPQLTKALPQSRKSSTARPSKSASGTGSFGNWIIAASLLAISGSLLAYRLGVTEASQSERERFSLLGDDASDVTDMAPDILPGRPGNLTPDQEEKLREFWTATLQVFGALSGQDSIPSPTRVDSTLEKTKKKRLGIFGRKSKDSDTDSTTSAEATPTGESEDKYGQTKQFQDALASQSPAALRDTFWSMVKHDHPDALLLRFLRARKWDVDKALIMMVSTMKWRATEMHVDDDIILSGEEGMQEASQGSNSETKSLGQGFMEQMRLGISYLHGLDKAGRPICFVRVRLHKQGDQSEESLERYTVFVIETARMILAPPIDTACILFDMTGFTLANMDYAPVRFMIKCFEANYPESLGVVLVHKAPWIFQGIWKIIKGWLDPVVASKIRFTNSVDDMQEFIARNQIPKELDGDENWSYQYIEPASGENEKMKDVETRDKMLAERAQIVKEFEAETISWVNLKDKSQASAIKERRSKLASALREDYWKLDPYVRARSLYDRVGMIQPGGKLQFYPPTTTTESPAINGDQKG